MIDKDEIPDGLVDMASDEPNQPTALWRSSSD